MKRAIIFNLVAIILLVLFIMNFNSITGLVVKDVNQDNLLITFCDVDASIKCESYDVNSNGIEFSFRNNIPYDLEKVKVKVLDQQTNKEICKLTCENCESNKMLKDSVTIWKGSCSIEEDVFLGRISMDFEIQENPITVIGTIKDKV